MLKKPDYERPGFASWNFNGCAIALGTSCGISSFDVLRVIFSSFYLSRSKSVSTSLFERLPLSVCLPSKYSLVEIPDFFHSEIESWSDEVFLFVCPLESLVLLLFLRSDLNLNPSYC